jgi:hypothetical protein
MNDDALVRDVWKTFAHRDVVGVRLVRTVGARAWERPRFGLFHKFFERCGVPDPWDPDAPDVEIGLGDVGVAAPRRAVAPHAAPPGQQPAAPKGPNLPNAPRSPTPGIPTAPPRAAAEGGRPAPRIGETRKDDTALLKKKSAEEEKKKANPARANAFKVNQPLAKLPTRPDLAGDAASPGGTPSSPRPGPGAPSGASAAPPPRPAASRPAAPSLPTRPGVGSGSGSAAQPGSSPPSPSGGTPSRPTEPARPAPRPAMNPGSARPTRMAIEPVRRAQLPDGPEEIDELPPLASRPGADRAYGGFGLGGGWDDDPVPAREAGGWALEELALPLEDAQRAVGAHADRSAASSGGDTSGGEVSGGAAAAGAVGAAGAAGAVGSRGSSPGGGPASVVERGEERVPARAGAPAASPPSGPMGSPARPASAPSAGPGAAPARPAAAAPASAAASASPGRPAPAAAPRAPAPPPRGRGGGLDDLFGMGGGGGGENTRVRMPKRDEAEANRPRRPMVTPESELKGATLDRRPPPPKPPTVKPTSGGGGMADPEGDGGD